MSAPPTSPPATALLVEDEALVAMVAEDNLRFLGFEPACVATAKEALDHFERHDSQLMLAIIDVGLPDMRGDALASDVRRRFPSVKVIVASGYDPVQLNERFASDRDVAVVSKPYSEDDLKRAIVALGLPVG